MNKKDCDKLGIILSISKSLEEVTDRICDLDERIKERYKFNEKCECRGDDINDLFDKKMKEKYGHNWPMLRVVTKDITKAVYAEAVKEVQNKE